MCVEGNNSWHKAITAAAVAAVQLTTGLDVVVPRPAPTRDDCVLLILLAEVLSTSNACNQ
jgi:hypothetical protein